MRCNLHEKITASIVIDGKQLHKQNSFISATIPNLLATDFVKNNHTYSLMYCEVTAWYTLSVHVSMLMLF